MPYIRKAQTKTMNKKKKKKKKKRKKKRYSEYKEELYDN